MKSHHASFGEQVSATKYLLKPLFRLIPALPPPRRLRTALLMAQHPEHIIHVVAHHLRTAVRNHPCRAQRVKVVPLIVSPRQQNTLQIQGNPARVYCTASCFAPFMHMMFANGWRDNVP